MESHRPNTLTTADTQRAKTSSLSEEHRAQRSRTSRSGCRDPSLFLYPPSAAAEQSPRNLSNTLGSYSLPEVRAQLGATGQGVRVQDTSPGLVCCRDTNIQQLSGALGDSATPSKCNIHVQSRDSVRGVQM